MSITHGHQRAFRALAVTLRRAAANARTDAARDCHQSFADALVEAADDLHQQDMAAHAQFDHPTITFDPKAKSK